MTPVSDVCGLFAGGLVNTVLAMSDPYGPTFPPPAFMAPQEPGPGERKSFGGFAVMAAPVATLAVVVGVLVAIMWQADHPASARIGEVEVPPIVSATATAPHAASS